MAMGPKGRALKYSGQPTNLGLKKSAQTNVNTRKNRDVSTVGKNLPGKNKADKAVRKIGTPYHLPEVTSPPGF